MSFSKREILRRRLETIQKHHSLEFDRLRIDDESIKFKCRYNEIILISVKRGKGYHSLVAFFDSSHTTVELFDPLGRSSHFERVYNIFASLGYQVVDISPKYMGFQRRQIIEDGKRGLCAVWRLWFIEQSLSTDKHLHRLITDLMERLDETGYSEEINKYLLTLTS